MSLSSRYVNFESNMPVPNKAEHLQQKYMVIMTCHRLKKKIKITLVIVMKVLIKI